MKVLSAEHEATAAGPEGFPTEDLPEIAFLGRSNVGKSSLLNRLVGRKQLARTSGTPGKTRLLHFYRVVGRERTVLFVDLPGYGYARVSRKERERWRRMIEGYLEGRTPLRAAVLLQDARRDPSEDEILLLRWLEARAIPTLVVLTKTDKLKPSQRERHLRSLREGFRGVQADWILPTSARTGAGLEALWRALDTLVR